MQGYNVVELADIFSTVALPRFLALALPRSVSTLAPDREFSPMQGAVNAKVVSLLEIPGEWPARPVLPATIVDQFRLERIFHFKIGAEELDVSPLFLQKADGQSSPLPKRRRIDEGLAGVAAVQSDLLYMLGMDAAKLQSSSLVFKSHAQPWPPQCGSGSGGSPMDMRADATPFLSLPPAALDIIDPCTFTFVWSAVKFLRIPLTFSPFFFCVFGSGGSYDRSE